MDVMSAIRTLQVTLTLHQGEPISIPIRYEVHDGSPDAHDSDASEPIKLRHICPLQDLHIGRMTYRGRPIWIMYLS